MLKILVFIQAFILFGLAKKKSDLPNQSQALTDVSLAMKQATIDSAYISLTNTSTGYTVKVNFGNDASDSEDYPVFLALYSNTTFLATQCMSFSSYECSSKFGCSSPYTANSSIDLPYLQANGTWANTKVFMNKKYWASNTALLVTECASNATENFGLGAYGLLGMGVDGVQKTNFLNSSLFSIYLEDDLSAGDLFFGFDSSKAQKTAFNATLVADLNWAVSGVNQVNIGPASVNTSSTNMLFDVNSDAIGLPISIYYSLLSSINENKLMTCEMDKNSFPACEYNGEIADIPNLAIVVGNQSLSIPAQYFAKSNPTTDDDQSSITLYFKATAPNETGESFVFEKYQNYIIIDRHIMAYYYTLFDATNPKGNVINLYIADHQDHTLLYIILAGSVIFVGLCFCFVVFVFCCSSNPNQTKLHRKTTKKLENNDLLQPLIENQNNRVSISKKLQGPKTE